MSPTTSSLPLPTAIIYPIVEGVAKAYKTPVTFVMIHTVFGAILVPLLIATFAFSNSRTRRTPIFMGVVGSMLLGLVLAVWNDYIMVHAMLSPLRPPSTSLRYGFVWLSFSMSWMVDLVLVLRLLAVYPRESTPSLQWYCIFFVPFALKSARLGCVVTFFVDYVRSATQNGGTLQSALADGNSLKIYRSHYFQALWVLQMVDNGFIAAMFLWRLRKSFGIRVTNIGRDTNETKISFVNRVRTLFWIALTNFLFPVTLNIVQMAVVFSSPFYVIAYLENVNSYVSIIGLVFATVWGNASSQQHQNKTPFQSSSISSRRARPQVSHAFDPRSTVTTPAGLHEPPIVDIGKWDDADSRHDLHAEDGIGLQVRIDRTRESDIA